MIMRGGGASGADGLSGVAGICVTLLGKALVALLVRALGAVGGAAVVADGGVARCGTAVAGGAVEVGLPAGGVAGVFGGITTTDGGRYVAATEAGVTSLGVAGDCGDADVSTADFGGNAFGAPDNDGVDGADTAGASTLVSTKGGLAAERAAGGSTAPFRCWMARSTSPGCEMCDRSILVLISSSLLPTP